MWGVTWTEAKKRRHEAGPQGKEVFARKQGPVEMLVYSSLSRTLRLSGQESGRDCVGRVQYKTRRGQGESLIIKGIQQVLKGEILKYIGLSVWMSGSN